jgi:hypothetical protein
MRRPTLFQLAPQTPGEQGTLDEVRGQRPNGLSEPLPSLEGLGAEDLIR